MCDEKEEMPEMPKVLQNAVRSLYLMGFGMILLAMFAIFAYFIWGLQSTSYYLGLYLFAQGIIIFLYINENLQIPKVEW